MTILTIYWRSKHYLCTNDIQFKDNLVGIDGGIVEVAT